MVDVYVHHRAFEHSVAGLHVRIASGAAFAARRDEIITWSGYGYNLGLATLGNIIGGAIFVAGPGWVGSPKARETGPDGGFRRKPNGVGDESDILPPLPVREAV